MNLAQYCHQKGMSKEQYEQVKKEVQEKVESTYTKALEVCVVDSGMFYQTDLILDYTDEYEPFIIQGLKKKGMEFYRANQLFRI